MLHFGQEWYIKVQRIALIKFSYNVVDVFLYCKQFNHCYLSSSKFMHLSDGFHTNTYWLVSNTISEIGKSI